MLEDWIIVPYNQMLVDVFDKQSSLLLLWHFHYRRNADDFSAS